MIGMGSYRSINPSNASGQLSRTAVSNNSIHPPQSPSNEQTQQDVASPITAKTPKKEKKEKGKDKEGKKKDGKSKRSAAEEGAGADEEQPKVCM